LRREVWVFASSYVAANSLFSRASYERVFNAGDPAEPPPGRVSVVVPGWHEPRHFLEASLSSLKEQTVVWSFPDRFEYVFVGCEGVDLDVPERYGYRVLCAPRGKLNARHLGIVSSSGDIIVAADSDTFYPPNWLNLVLKPFKEPDVVGVCTPTWQGWLEPLVGIPKALVFAYKMTGRGSAFRKSAYFEVGGFNLAVNQENIRELWLEEEFLFYRRLRSRGRIAYVDAPVIHLGVETVGRGLRPYPRGKRAYAT
jgi:cellulose synthase/poly-beta-1,6-N-acetylglucosamine synthase-like glycosyltransferase